MTLDDRYIDDLLKLSEDERARVARALLASLDVGDADADADTAWAAELAQRVNSLGAGRATLIEASEVRRRVQERLRAIRSSK